MTDNIKEQHDDFVTGTISQFCGLLFITIIPFLIDRMNIFIELHKYKLTAIIFFLIAIFFYFNSPAYTKWQLLVIGVNFIFFSLFQLFLFPFVLNIYIFLKILALIIGIILVVLSARKNFDTLH